MNSIGIGGLFLLGAALLTLGFVLGLRDRDHDIRLLRAENVWLRAGNERLRNEGRAYKAAVHVVADELALVNPAFASRARELRQP